MRSGAFARRKPAVWLALGATALAAGSVPAAASEVLDWGKAVEETLARNPDIRSAWLTVLANEDQVREAYSGFLPQLSGQMNSSYANTAVSTTNANGTVTGGGSSTSKSADTFFTAALSGSETLFSGFSTLAGIKQQQAGLDTAIAAWALAKTNVSYALKTAYEGMLYGQEYLSLSQDIIQRRLENLKIVELRFQNGDENKGSLLLSQAYLVDAKYGRLQAQDAIDVARRQLAQVLGRDSDEPGDFTLTGEVPVTEPSGRPDLHALALSVPSYLTAVATEESADASFMSARSAFFPTVNLVGVASSSGNSFFPWDSRTWSVGLNISYPFFTGGHDFFNTRNNISLWKAAMAARESADRGAMSNLKVNYVQWIESVEKLKVDQTYLAASTVREKIGRSKYNNGLLTFEDWDLIETDLITRQKSVLTSRQNRVVQEAGWEQAQGAGVFAGAAGVVAEGTGAMK